MKIIRFFRSHIVAELVLVFSFVALVPLILVMGTHYMHAQEDMKREIKTRLDAIADAKRDAVEFYTQEKLNQLRVISRMPQMTQMLLSLNEAGRLYGVESAQYAAMEKEMMPFFSYLTRTLGLYDLFLISKEGDILFTVAREKDLYTNLRTGPYRESALFDVFEYATTVLQSEISDFRYYGPSQEPAAFTAVALVKDHKIIGAVAVQFSFDYLETILHDYSSLGMTGEVVTGGVSEEKTVFTSHLRHRNDAILVDYEYDDMRPNGLIMGMQGGRGHGEIIDYRGKEVIASWRYVPSLRWGLVVKIDKDEEYAALYKEQKIILAIMAVSVGLVLIAIMFATRMISRPILHVGLVARSFANGNLAVRIGNVSENELGVLARDFNTMASAIEENQANLEKEIARQTEALSKSKNQLDSIINFAPVIIFLKDREGRFLRVNEAFLSFVAKPQEQVIGKSSREIFGDEHGLTLMKHDAEVFASGRAKRFEELLFVDGEEHTFITVKFSLRDDKGEAYALCGIATEITKQKKLFDELEKNRDGLNKAQEIAHIGSWEWDITAGTLVWSDEIYRIFGLSPQEFGATYEVFLEAIHPDDRDKVTSAVGASLEKDVPYSVAHRIVRPNGEVRIVQEEGEIKRDSEGTPLQMIGIVHDVTAITQVQQKLESANSEMEKYLKIINENVIISRTDKEGIITYASKAFCRISGYSSEELVGQPHSIVRHPDTPKALYAKMWKVILSGKVWKGEVKNRKKDGGHYWIEMTITPSFDEERKITGFMAIREDITDKKKIEEISITDALTGLYNRRHFDKVIAQEYNRSRRNGKMLIFIIMDVDHFKQYNDTYGHQMGDDVLRQIGKTLRTSLTRTHDFPFRIGGEEFGIVTSDMSEEKAVAFADKIRVAVQQLHIEHKGNSAARHVTISMGVAVKSPEGGESVETLIHKADEALYAAKKDGRNRVCLTRSTL